MSLLPPSLLRWSAAPDTALVQHTCYQPGQGIVLTPGATAATLTGDRLPVSWATAVPSWQATAPLGTAIEIELRAEIDGRWTRWYALGQWSSDPTLRHSVEGQDDADAAVATDTLKLKLPAEALQWRVTLCGTAEQSPALRGVAVAVGPHAGSEPTDAPRQAVGPLRLPELSQLAYPNGGPVWCSPTALTMVLGYWYEHTRWPQLAPFEAANAVAEIVAPGVYDPVYGGTGNWPFNTAFAAALGLEAYVLQLRGLDDAHAWLSVGVPLVASIAFERGALDNTPAGFQRSSGHLVLVVGLTGDGDVIVHDPRADTRIGEDVRRVYRRDQFLRAWQHSRYAVYLIYPPGHIE